MVSHNDLTFFTNDENNTLLDRFCTILKDVRFFDVLVGYFRISGFHQLYASLENVEKIRILIGLKTDSTTYNIIEQSKNNNEIAFETHARTAEITSKRLTEEIVSSEDTLEVEEGILKFIEWLQSGKMEIKAHPSQRIHAKVYISRYHDDDRDYGNVITGSSNFSESGLVGNYEFNVQLKNSTDVDFALEKFENLWNEAVDVTEIYVDTVQTKTHLNNDITPYDIYLKVLYEYFKEDLSLNPDLFYEDVPSYFKKLKYQEQAVINAKRILDEFGGVFLADVVGLGKTFMAALLATQLPGRTLVIASPALINRDNPNSWPNVFYDFRIPADFYSTGELKKIIERGTERYDNVIIDEAHKFRNENTIGYELLSIITRGKKVVLVTATPLNNSPEDILAQIKLFQQPKNSTIPGIKDLEKFFKSLQKKLDNLDRKNDFEEYMQVVKENAAIIRNNVLKYIMIRRTRSEIEKYFKDDLKKQGMRFPKVNDPIAVFYQLDKKLNQIFMETIRLITDKKSFTYARYMPLLYLKRPLTEFEKTGQKNLAGFMKILLVKRLESSFEAFRKTIDRFITSHEHFLKVYREGKVYISKKHWKKIMEYYFDGKFEKIRELIENEQADKYDKNQFTKQLEKDIEKDLKTLKHIRKLWQSINYDPKLESFLQRLKEDSVLKNNKIIVFTESKETAEYLQKQLKANLNEPVLLYHGQSDESVLKTVIENFDANARHPRDDYRILITTEVLSEGINLHRSNVVINYDIPWNPTRMIQRVGRINRVNTSHEEIFIYNFFPSEQGNNVMKLKESAIAKIQYFIEMLGNDAKLLTEGEEIKSFELFNTLTSKKTLMAEDEGEESELKYLKIIENIRDNKPELFGRIKQLPPKARTARTTKYPSNRNSLITYFRKGKLEKFYLASSNGSRELDFLSAIKLLEAGPKEKKHKIPPDFYELLKMNKRQMDLDLSEDITENLARGGSRNNAQKIQKILQSKEMRRYNGFTEIEEEYLKDVIRLLNEGGIPKRLTKTIYRKIKDLKDPKRILLTVKKNLPDQLFAPMQTNENNFRRQPKEIILSEYLL